jgi:catechol 2,3-dioxygenase-like lactoylglutathione lyase family enzyme
MIRKRVDHIGLNVVDLEKSIAFYQDMFGFSVIEKWETPKQAFIETDDIVLGLIQMPLYDYRAYTMAHLAFSCDKADFHKVYAKIQAFKLEVVSGPKEQRGGETILFRDPSGNILEICYPSITEWKASQENR